jgi:hypothetical protein
MRRGGNPRASAGFLEKIPPKGRKACADEFLSDERVSV